MEGQQIETSFIVLGSILILVVIAVVIVFIINHKRHLHGKQQLIQMYENDFETRIESLEAKVERLEKENAQLKARL